MATSNSNPVEPFYSIFCAAFELWSGGVPYRPAAGRNRDGDFVQFADLRRTVAQSPKPEWLTVERFERAVRNYFASPIGRPTLADLCVRFATFYQSPVDQFGKPVRRVVETVTPAPEFQFCSNECRAIFIAGGWSCNDCETRLAAHLGAG